MKQIGWLISRYLLTTIIPYFIFSWLLLSVILFVQQAGRYSDIFFSINVPTTLVWRLTLALIPNVIAFTCPMAVLVGTIIGLTKMQGDSELVAIRASGVGNLQIATPIVLLGIVLSGFALLVNLEGVPFAASLVRTVALQAAIKKLESPLEPGVFNTEVAGYTIYVKGGDVESGRWKNIFIYTKDDAAGQVRLITSPNGRIDTTGNLSELVLENATASTLPASPGEGQYVSEHIGELRLAIRAKRGDLIDKLSSSAVALDELGLGQLSALAANSDGKERIEAQILWQRRIILSVTPLIFCMLGTVIVLRFNRSGRGFGIALALLVLIGFYLLAFLGEQLARVGVLSVSVGSLIPLVSSALAIFWLSYSRKTDLLGSLSDRLGAAVSSLKKAPRKLQMRDLFVDLTTGLRDFDILRNLLKNFALTLCFLSAIFVIFTGFELWRYAGAINGGVFLLSKYLLYLLPFVYLQIAPPAAMVGTLATYVIKSRQNEIVTWTAAGQSVYRLLLPCLLLMLVIGGANWLIQERVLPHANQVQDETRTLIRNRGVPENGSGKYWVANDKRIYSFETASDNEKPSTQDASSVASDNEKRDTAGANVWISNLTVYEFANNGADLQTVYRSQKARWAVGNVIFDGKVEVSEMNDGRISTSLAEGRALSEPLNPFVELRTKPTHLTSSELERQIAAADSETEQRNLTVALARKYTTPFLPFVMALFTAPFSLSMSRKGKAVTVGYAIGLWLLFTGTSGIFEQMGLNGLLRPSIAVWSPLVIFSLIGIYLLSKVRT